jgi:hypothetical protein
MKPSPSKIAKAASGKKKSRDEASGSAAGTSPPVSPPWTDPNREWKKSKAKTEDLLALLNSGFLREKEVDMWRAAAGDPYPMEKNEDEIPMFVRFAERGLSLPASNFFKGLMGYYGMEYRNLNPNGIFHTAVFVHFCEAFLGIKPHWILFRKFFRVKPQPSASNPRVVVQAHRLQSRLKGQVVLHHEPPSGYAKAEREAAQAPPMVEHGANNARRDPAARVVGADQGAEGSWAEGRAHGLQLHEAQGAATDGSRHPGVRVHRR